MKIEFRSLFEIDKNEIIELMNHPLVKRHMPLAKDHFDENDYTTFIKDKEQLWIKHGYGPWAFVIDGKFAGWGGLQYEQEDADLALVLHPKFWGIGQVIYCMIIQKAFSEMGFESITVLLPPSRTRIRGLLSLHFKPDGELLIEGKRFLRYRLYATDAGI